MSGDHYRRARAQAAFALEALNKIIPVETVDGLDWRWLAEQVERSPQNLLTAVSELATRDKKSLFGELLSGIEAQKIFPRTVTWTLLDSRRVMLVPAGHWLLIEDTVPFRATLETRSAECGVRSGADVAHVQSIAAEGRLRCVFCAARNGWRCKIVPGAPCRGFAENFRRDSFCWASSRRFPFPARRFRRLIR